MFDNYDLHDVCERISTLERAGVKTSAEKAAYYGGCRGCSSSCSGSCGGDCSAAFSECFVTI